MTEIDTYIGERVKAYRTEKGLTLQELADILGCTHASASQRENGKQGFTVKAIFTMCSVFGITPNDLFPPIPKMKVKKVKAHVVVTRTKVPKKLTVTPPPDKQTFLKSLENEKK